MKIAQNISDLVGNTPLFRLNNINSNILAKCEFLNPTSSIKDRVAVSMIDDAIKNNKIDKNTTIIEPTSGNTGIALASICASLGYKLILTMPESMSVERVSLLKSLGADIRLTPKKLGMNGAIQKAKELNQQIDNSIILEQFSNPANPKSHIKTAHEILKDSNKEIDIFVAGIGTGGTLSGVGRELKKYIPNIKIIGVEPFNSAILSNGIITHHEIQGIGAGFIPKVLDISIIDEIIKVTDKEAFDGAKKLISKEGLLVGISSGANFIASNLVSQKYTDKTIVTILPDTAQRYLSTRLFK